MELFAVFETWHIGDGNYPPLKRDQLVNLSFEVEPEVMKRAQSDAPLEFHHLGQARYEFTGIVLRVYKQGGDRCPLVVIEAGGFRFYMDSELANAFGPGDVLTGRGTLLFDHYIWVEFLSSYPDPPDLFCKLRVGRIWLRKIPERFISRSGRSTASPTYVQPEDYGPDDIAEVDAVSTEDFVDYVIQFSDCDIPNETIARTFHA